MTYREVITLDTPLYIERESGFELAQVNELQQGSIYHTQTQGEPPQLKRVVGSPEPVFDAHHQHIIEWQVEATHEL